MRKTAQHSLEQTLAHESRHAGFCASHGLEVVEVAVHGPGEGCTSVRTPSVEAVRALHTQDPRAARELVINLIAGVVGGPRHDEAFNPTDEARALQDAAMGEAVTDRDALALCRIAKVRALKWAIKQEAAVQAFARQVDSERVLSGADLQRR